MRISDWSSDVCSSDPLNRALWDQPSRPQWFGGGYDKPGIHSISLDPRDDRRIAIAISCGGVWETTDGGESWRSAGDGLVATYMPPAHQRHPVPQDPPRLVRCHAAPDTMWLTDRKRVVSGKSVSVR